MNEQALPAFVLHRRDYRETSLLLEIFAPETGRFAAVARGARRPRNPAGALLQPFQPLWLCVSGRGEVRNLTRIETSERALPLAGGALACGFYLNELLMRLLARQDPHQELFACYRAALARLVRDDEPDDALRQFELRLLAELGYGLTLDREAGSGEPVRSGIRYRYEPRVGGVHRLAPPGIAPGIAPDIASGDALDIAPGVAPGIALGVMESAAVAYASSDNRWDGDAVSLSGDTLLALALDTPLEPARRREARDLLRRALEPHLGERPLRSRDWFRRPPSAAGRAPPVV